ncbi:M20 family metallopeptidase [Paraburkholderia sp.]|uniref:M20 family metallopeptidase n=1 Tax=Paraburkholderia sp. TaxID=1926495 RepID=UPI0039E3FBA1
MDTAMVPIRSQSGMDAVTLTKDLVRIPSINPPGNEQACASYMAEVLSSIGFDVALQTFGEKRFNLVANLRGSACVKPIGFTGHLDTVPLGEAQWSRAPLGAEIDDGRLYGRGSSDMKAGIAAFVAACANHADAIRAGAGVHLVLTGGEETGCDGARALAGAARHLMRDVALLVVGEPTSNYPFVGHKGALWMRATARGRAAHGSMPEQGVNAIYKAAEAISKLKAFSLGAPTHPLMGDATMNVGTIRGGLNVNSVPDRAEFEVDIRTVPGLDHQCLCARLSNYLTDEVELDRLVDVPPLTSDWRNPLMQRVWEVCAPYHREALTARSAPYFTDGGVLSSVTGNPPTVILGPGEPSMAHKVDEFCLVSRIDEAVEIYGALIADRAINGN